MIFAPHILQVLIQSEPVEDEFGRIISDSLREWMTLGECRCDDVSADRRISVNGVAYDFRYKVVFDSSIEVREGTQVRCLRTDGSVRGEGVCKSPLEANFLPYKTIWLE